MKVLLAASMLMPCLLLSVGSAGKDSGEFKAGEDSVPARLFFGMVPLDAKLKQIASGEVFAIPGTENRLAAMEVYHLLRGKATVRC